MTGFDFVAFTVAGLAIVLAVINAIAHRNLPAMGSAPAEQPASGDEAPVPVPV